MRGPTLALGGERHVRLGARAHQPAAPSAIRSAISRAAIRRGRQLELEGAMTEPGDFHMDYYIEASQLNQRSNVTGVPRLLAGMQPRVGSGASTPVNCVNR